ncbi:MAG: MFS transporter [Candidatus Aminicenantes bacterium]|nr:MFS transporter [Candidatus Aminicenantes bacterium]
MNNDILSYDESTKRAVLVVSTLAGFLTPFMGSSMNVALPAVAAEFSMKAVSMSWVPMAYMLAAAVSLVPFGRLGDIRGRKKIFILGLVVYTLASLLSALSFSAVSLIVFRALQGIGGAMVMGTSLAILTSVYPSCDRGRVLGINTAAVYLGLSLGPVLGGFLTQHFGWRSLFLVMVPIGLPALVLALVKLPGEPAESKGEKFDTAGTVLFGMGLAALMFGFSRLPAVPGVVFILLGLAGLAVFVLWEKRSKAPLLDIRLFRTNRVFAFSNAAALINYSATSAVAFLLSLYLQYIKGMSPQQAGLILIAQPVVMTVFSPLAGKLSDRIEPRVVASAGMGITSAGLFLFILLGPSSSLFFIVSSLLCLGFGFALFSSPNTNAVMGSVDRRSYGVASSTLGTMRLTGQMLSMGVSVLIFALCMGNVRITPEHHPAFLRSLVAAFAVFGVLCVIGVFASLARGNRKSGTQYQFPN